MPHFDHGVFACLYGVLRSLTFPRAAGPGRRLLFLDEREYHHGIGRPTHANTSPESKSIGRAVGARENVE